MKDTGQIYAEIANAICDAYSRVELAAMVSKHLNSDLDRVASEGSLEEVTVQLVQWAKRRERLDDLLHGALAERPKSAGLRQASDDYDEYLAAQREQAKAEKKAAAPEHGQGNSLTEPPEDQAALQIFAAKSEVYNAGIQTLRRAEWQRLRIFAPVGLWDHSNLKLRWLDTVARQMKRERLGRTMGVFGLPPLVQGDSVDDETIARLVQARHALELLNGIKDIDLHYYPPFPAAVGFGVLIFENQLGYGETAIAFSQHEDEYIIDSGFGFSNREVFTNIRQWFDHQIFDKATSDFVLQKAGRPLAQEWEHIVRRHYGEEYLYGFTLAWNSQ